MQHVLDVTTGNRGEEAGRISCRDRCPQFGQIGRGHLHRAGPRVQRHRMRLGWLSVINRLTWRAGPGDEVLAEDLLACLRGEPLAGRVVPVDLEMLGTELEGDPGMSTGGYLDLRTGAVYADSSTDPMMVGEDAAIDVDEEPDRWLGFECTCSRDGWRDMAAFTVRHHDPALRERLERAIEGRGAFGRFRDLVHQEGLAESWYAFSADRQLGRARAFLADQGIHAVISQGP